MDKKELLKAKLSVLDNKTRQAYGKKSAELHIHDDVQILAGSSGILEISVNSKKCNLRVGDVMIIKSRVPHSVKPILPFTSTLAIQIPTEDMFFTDFPKNHSVLALALTQGEEDYIYLRRENEITAEIFSTLTRMSEENSKEDASRALFTDGYTKILLGLLHRNGIISDLSTSFDKVAVAKLHTVFEHVEENLSREISLEEAATLNGMNREYFCRFFKKASGITFVDYVNFVRIFRAQELLISTQESISDISDSLGFSSVSYFTRVFKNITNTTPAYYRNIKYFKRDIL